jgi:hypothetical protein
VYIILKLKKVSAIKIKTRAVAHSEVATFGVRLVSVFQRISALAFIHVKMKLIEENENDRK